MLTIVMTLFGISMSDKITYYNYHYPQPKKEIVAEKEIPAIPEVVAEPPKEKETEKDPTSCSCVLFAQQFLDLPLNTDAIDLKSNSQPVIGSGILFDYNGIGHIAVIIGYEEDGFLVKESNYRKCEIGTRIVSFSDEAIVGFIK